MTPGEKRMHDETVILLNTEIERLSKEVNRLQALAWKYNLEKSGANYRLGTQNIGESTDNVGLSAQASIDDGYTNSPSDDAQQSQFAAKPKPAGSIIEEIGTEITWEILGSDLGWSVWASHTGSFNPDDDFKFTGSAKTLNEAIVTVAEELLAIGPKWVRNSDNTQQCQHLGSRTEYRSGIEECNECGDYVSETPPKVRRIEHDFD